MKQLLLSLSFLLAATITFAGNLKVKWPLGGDNTGTASIPYAAEDITCEVGPGLLENGTRDYNGVLFTVYDPNDGVESGVNSHGSAESLEKYADFTFTPKNCRFKPTRVSFDIVKFGTNDPNAFVDIITADGTLYIADNVEIVRNNAVENDPDNASSTHTYEITGAKETSGSITLHLLIGKLATGKNIGIANVTIEGTTDISTLAAETPVFSRNGNSLTITSATQDATIYYTLDGSNPRGGSGDFTSLVSTEPTAWTDKANSRNASSVPEYYVPLAITADGRNSNMVESYQNSADATGVILEQTIEGLENGNYEVQLYANSCFTEGRGFSSDIEDGSTDVAYVYANASKVFIPCKIATSVSANGLYTINCQVTDGTLRIGLGKEKSGTNWHTIQICSLKKEDTQIIKYEAPIALTKNCTVKAIAVAEGYEDSEVATYTVDWFEDKLYSYTVNEVANGVILRTTTGTGMLNDKIEVPYHKYVVLEKTLYSREATDGKYFTTFELKEDNMIVTLEYAKEDVDNVVFLSEGEDIEGLTPIESKNYYDMYGTRIDTSNSAAAYATQPTRITTLPPGRYKIHSIIFYNGELSPNAYIIIKAGDSVLIAYKPIDWLVGVNSEWFDLQESTEITMMYGYSDGSEYEFGDFDWERRLYLLDAIYIVSAAPLASLSFDDIAITNEANATITIAPTPSDAYFNPELVTFEVNTKGQDMVSGWTWMELERKDVLQWNFLPHSLGDFTINILYDGEKVGTGSVEVNQQLHLTDGWQWTALQGGTIGNINSALGSNLDEARSETAMVINDPQAGGYWGALSSMASGQTYKVKMKSEHTYNIAGSASAYHSMMLGSIAKEVHAGWNWVGNPYQYWQSINDIFSSDSQFDNGDIVKTKTQFATYSSGQWQPTIYVEPGQGMIIKKQKAGTITFNSEYGMEQNFTSPAASRNLQSAISNLQFPMADDSRFDDNMAMVARVEGVADPSAVTLWAFVGDECRGRGIGSIGLQFITVHGEQGEHFTFKVYDHATGQLRQIEETRPFAPASGTVQAPVILHVTPVETAIEEAETNRSAKNQTVYDLQGRHIDSSIQKKGVYIQDCHKIVIR